MCFLYSSEFLLLLYPFPHKVNRDFSISPSLQLLMLTSISPHWATACAVFLSDAVCALYMKGFSHSLQPLQHIFFPNDAAVKLPLLLSPDLTLLSPVASFSSFPQYSSLILTGGIFALVLTIFIPLTLQHP